MNARNAKISGAMANSGKLTIETSNVSVDEGYRQQNAGVPAGQYVLIAVSDTGSGMPREVQEKAFDPFFTTKQPGQGTGLGLSQVYGFVKQSGGEIKIYSEVGQGTTIRIYLPRAAAAPETVGQSEAPAGRQFGERDRPGGRGRMRCEVVSGRDAKGPELPGSRGGERRRPRWRCSTPIRSGSICC